MKQILILCFAGMGILCSCKHKKEQKIDKEKFFPALSFIKSQIAHIDTSVYSIIRVQAIDSVHNDTTYIRREDFKAAANDFLTIPDISDPMYADRYTEDNQFDETLNRVLMVYTPVNPDKEQIQRQEVLIKQEPPKDQVTNIIINSVVNTKDSVVEKKMLWKVDESFQVTVSRQLTGKPETVSTYKVIWNGNDIQ